MVGKDDDDKKLKNLTSSLSISASDEDELNKQLHRLHIDNHKKNYMKWTEEEKVKRLSILAQYDELHKSGSQSVMPHTTSDLSNSQNQDIIKKLKDHNFYHNTPEPTTSKKQISDFTNHQALTFASGDEKIHIVHHNDKDNNIDNVHVSDDMINDLKEKSKDNGKTYRIAVQRVDKKGNRLKDVNDYLVFVDGKLIIEKSDDKNGVKSQSRIQGLEHIVEDHAENKEHCREHILEGNGIKFESFVAPITNTTTVNVFDQFTEVDNKDVTPIIKAPTVNPFDEFTEVDNKDVAPIIKAPTVNPFDEFTEVDNKDVAPITNTTTVNPFDEFTEFQSAPIKTDTNPGITANSVTTKKDNTYSVTLSNDDGKTLNVSFQQDEKQRLFSVDKEKLKSFLKEQSELPHNLPLKKEKFQPNLDAIIQDQKHDLTAKDFNEMTQAMNGLVLQGIAKKAEQNPSVNIINANQPKERVFLRLLDESMKEANKYSEAIKIGEEIDKFDTSKSLDSKTRVQLLKLVTRYDDKNQKQKERNDLIRTPTIGPMLQDFIKFRKSENVAQNSGPSTANNVITNEKQSSIDIPLSSATQKKEVANPNTPPPPPPINQRPKASNPHPLTSSVKSGVAVSLPGETEEQTYGRELRNAVIIKDAKVETVENIMQKIVENGGDLENIINNPLGEKGTGLSPFHMAIYTQQTPDIVVAMSTFADFDKKNYNDKSAVDLINESPKKDEYIKALNDFIAIPENEAKKDAAIETGNKASIDTKLPNTPPPPPQSNAKSGIAVPSTHITPTDDVKKSTSSLPGNVLDAITGQSHTLQDANQRVLKPKEVQISAFEQNIIIASNIGNSEVTNENDREFKFEIKNDELYFVKETTKGNKHYKLTKDSITNYQDIFNKVEDDFGSSNISKEDQLNTELNKVIQTQDDKDKAAANQPEVEKTSITPQPISQTSDQTTIINDSKSSSLGLEDKTTNVGKLSSIHSVLSESVTKRRAGIDDDEESIDFKLVENNLYFVQDQKDYELDKNSIKDYEKILKKVKEEITEKGDYKEGDKISIDLSKNQIEELNNLVKEPTKINKISDGIKNALSSKLFPSKINKEKLPKINSLPDEIKNELEAILKLKTPAEKNRSISSESISSEASTDKESTLSSPPNSPKSKNSKSYLTVGGTVQPTKEIAGDIAGDIELTQLTTNHKIKRQTTHNKSGYGELSPPPSPNGGKPQGGKGMV